MTRVHTEHGTGTYQGGDPQTGQVAVNFTRRNYSGPVTGDPFPLGWYDAGEVERAE